MSKAKDTLSRRRFLATMGAALPAITLPGFVQAAGARPKGGKTLVLIELAGGNDGRNTVVPITDSVYRGLRPTIGIGRREALTLDRDTALHPAMGAMADLWESGDLCIVEGVGYPNPNRSHFRSIEIWNAGQGAETKAADGWVSTAFSGDAPQGTDADGLVLGGSMGPLRGPGRFSVLGNEDSFLETVQNLQSAPHAVRPQAKSALEHVLDTYESAELTMQTLATRLERARLRGFEFPDSFLGQQLRSAARLLEAGVDVPVFKVVHGGFDTHDNQLEEHAYLLEELSEAIGAFSRALRKMGLWEDVTLVTYSEFGRTARENGSAGTDHGTAAPVFVAGGGGRGGFDGARVDLTRLHEDDLVHTTDYRALYDGLLSGLWDINAPVFQGFRAESLRLIA